MSDLQVDVAVIGGGIAGMAVAAELAPHRTVALLEQEKELAFHSSGRSAAAFLETYGSPAIRALTQASRPLFDEREPDEPPLLTPRPMLWLAAEGSEPELEALVAAEPLLRPIDGATVLRLCPAVRPGWTHAAGIEDGAQDLDVAALFDRYRRRALLRGATILTSSPLVAAARSGSSYVLTAGAASVRAQVVVNAAGAWADVVAATMGVPGIGIAPLRRTVAIASATVDRSWPLVCDIAESFYFRPEGDALLVSLADETPDVPGDARAQMEDVALALDNVNQATTLNLRHVRRTWAGLRTFTPDRDPVVGYDPADPSFFWLAGLGGYGMQTAPALAQLAAALVRHEPAPVPLDPTPLAPARFR